MKTHDQMKDTPTTHRRLLWQIPFLMFLIGGTLYIAHRQRTVPYQHETGRIFGTVYNVTYQCDRSLKQSIERELGLVDASLSTFNPASTISCINRSESEDTDEWFREVFALAQQVSKDTEGAFDITVAPLVNAWGFGFKQGTTPTPQAIDSLCALVSYEKVGLTGKRLHKQDPRIMLDCAAIAKGYGSDVVARMLRKKGVENFMVEIGGEIVVAGRNAEQKPWSIGVSKPAEDSLAQHQELQAVLTLTDKAMATSGNYRNFYYKGGRKYAHTIDPKTGSPVQHSLLSATVLAPTCAMADAYATAFMVMGIEKAQQVLGRHKELAAYFIYATADGKNAVWYSPSLKKLIAE